MKSNFKIGIIGGNGQMGKALKNFFEKRDISVKISDINTFTSNQEVAENSDILVIAIPSYEYESVLKEIKINLTEDKLLMDIGSLKTREYEIMKKYHQGPIIATHSLFGPEKNFEGKDNTIIVYFEKENEKINFILNLFKKANLKVIKISPEEHDRIMSYIHGFYYLLNITYVSILKDEFSSIENIKFSPTSFKKYIEGLDHIFNTPSWLIEFIAYENSFINEVKEKFINKLNSKIHVKSIKEFLGYE